LAKPGLSGLSSNSSLQMAQILMGKGIFGSNDYFKSWLNHDWALDFEAKKRGRWGTVWERFCVFARMMAGQGGHP
jgi:hypothetical protein